MPETELQNFSQKQASNELCFRLPMLKHMDQVSAYIIDPAIGQAPALCSETLIAGLLTFIC
jgi:hypothetical protein